MTQTLLTIAGTDPSGAAGIQVDLQVFRDHGLHGASAITALLWQNTVGVRGLRACSRDEVCAQLDAVFEDLPIAAVKIGLVPNAAVAEGIGESLRRHDPDAALVVVLDPVSESGDGVTPLVEPGTWMALREHLLERVTVLTPNVREASAWLEHELSTSEALLEAAHALLSMGPRHVLLKAGHLPGMAQSASIQDIWASSDEVVLLEALPTIPEDVRGTGCQLSSAIAAGLAVGRAPRRAAEEARIYLNGLLHHQREHIGQGRPVILRS